MYLVCKQLKKQLVSYILVTTFSIWGLVKTFYLLCNFLSTNGRVFQDSCRGLRVYSCKQYRVSQKKRVRTNVSISLNISCSLIWLPYSHILYKEVETNPSSIVYKTSATSHCDVSVHRLSIKHCTSLCDVAYEMLLQAAFGTISASTRWRAKPGFKLTGCSLAHNNAKVSGDVLVYCFIPENSPYSLID